MQILPFILQKENVIKVKFYTIDIDYIKYLYSYDSEVYLNKQRHDYENKPYVGSLYTITQFLICSFNLRKTKTFKIEK